MPAHKLKKTYLLDLTDRAYPFGLNAFICSDPTDEVKRDETRNQIMHAFGKLWPEILEGQYVKRYLPHIVITLIENPTLSLANVERLLDDENYRRQYTSHVSNAATRSFWQHYESLPKHRRITETNPLRTRLDQLLTEPVISNILRQTKKTVNIRELIEDRCILLVKLPVNQEAYKYSAPVIGTFLMAMIYAATFSFDDIPNLEDRPGFTLIVDEFQNFATDEYAKLFEQGGKYKVKQFLAHQHRQQLEREKMGRTNLAATKSANTIIAFRLITDDARELASLYRAIAEQQKPTDIFIHPLEKIDEHSHSTVKQFVLDVVDKLDKASGLKLETKREWYKERKTRFFRTRPYSFTEEIPRSFTYKVNPQFDFGAGSIEVAPDKADAALTLLERLIYESEKEGRVQETLKAEFINAVTPFWKLASDKPDEQEEARERKTRFARLLDTVLAILINDPIANDETVSNADIASLLERLEKRSAFVKIGATAYAMKTRDTKDLYKELHTDYVSAQEAAQRQSQVREQTRARYCLPRTDLPELEEAAIVDEASETQPIEEEEEEKEAVPEQREEREPLELAEPEIPPPAAPVKKAPEQVPPILTESQDSMNMLYMQLRGREIDPDTTILASLGEHYVLTIRQWMRLFDWKSYPKATAHFKKLRESGMIYHKDREGRGGSLVTGDWFFLLSKGANELTRRKQPAALFKLEPNEAEKASGDTLFHTYLVNEVLIHLRLLERQQPEIVRIEELVHERSLRRQYLAALQGFKLYPDGFLQLLVPTPNGLKRRYTFLELQHTTQKDEAAWKAKCRKYLALLSRGDTLEKFFATRSPQVVVLAMSDEYAAQHKRWTEEVLQEKGERGRAYSNRFLIGAYDPGISDNTVMPQDFFCTSRFLPPFHNDPRPFIG
jgi:hypothetical protein